LNNLNIQNTLSQEKLIFRQLKKKERLQFFTYIFETGSDDTSAMGLSFKLVKRLCKIDRILLGLPFNLILKNLKVFVLDYEGEMVGGFSLTNINKSTQYLLGNVFIKPSLQEQGLGNIMLKKIVSGFNDKPIKLYVSTNNKSAIHLYENYGFIEKERRQEYLFEFPLEEIELAVNCILRPAVKEDLKKIGKLSASLTESEDLEKLLKNSLNKTSKKILRFKYQFSVVLIKDDEIIGVGFATWTKFSPNTAVVSIKVGSAEAKAVYAQFFNYIVRRIQNYAIERVISFKNEINHQEFVQIEGFAKRMLKEEIIMLKTAD
jgi:N-acetylglutamate synthase-like GNAT family acetyltransferase